MDQNAMKNMLLVHEAEMATMKSDLRDLGRIVEAVANVIANIGERIPGETTELAVQLRTLLFERTQLMQRRPELYSRGMRPGLGEGS